MPLRLLLASAFGASALAFGPVGNACNDTSPAQTWTYSAATGALVSSTSGLCLTSSDFPVTDGTDLRMAPCDGGPHQAFNLTSEKYIVLRVDPIKCVNLAGYGTSPGTQVWLYGCQPPNYSCQGNCDFAPSPDAHFRNSESGLCLDDGTVPPQPATCDPASPAAGLPLCDASLSFEQRAADLVSRLPASYKQSLLMLPYPVSMSALVLPQLPLAAFYWDITMIHGISTCCGFIDPLPDATAFPHSIAQGASFDVDLVARIAAAVATEARIVNQINFRETGGTTFQSLHAEGGPLSNLVHDPRWGRAQETYGEDPFLSARMAVTYTRTLQNRSSSHPFLQTASMTRHYLGFHGATDLPNAGEEWVDAQWLADMHLPSYEAQMTEGQAEGIMCSCNTMRVGPGDGSAGVIPACVHPLLYDILRNRWNSSALVQMDNEALYPMFQDHHYYPNLGAAIVGALDAGVVAVDSGMGKDILAELAVQVAAGNVTAAQVDAFATRSCLLRFRLGEFDSANPANPFRGPWDESLLDSPQHRALAREAVTKSSALLKNAGGFLPLASAPKQIAVIGPWGACTDASGSYGCNSCMSGNYAAKTSKVSGVLDALVEEVGATSNVTFMQGTDQYAPSSPTGIADAAALAAASDLTILVLGLGCGIETEGQDRPFLHLPAVQDELLAAVGLAQRPGARLLLSTVSANVIDLDASLADAWIQAFLPGEEAGHGLFDLVFGRASPSARLPLTLYADEYLEVCGPTADFNMISAATGVGRTYRFADRIPPALVKMMFGYGLSFSSFTYSALSATVLANNSVAVTLTVANSGAFSPAREVVQLYVSVPPVAGLATPLRNLRGFQVATLATGAPQQIAFLLAYPDAFLTTAADGTRSVTGGSYGVAVSGHQPDDALGAAQSNVVTTAVTLLAAAAGNKLVL